MLWPLFHVPTFASSSSFRTEGRPGRDVLLLCPRRVQSWRCHCCLRVLRPCRVLFRCRTRTSSGRIEARQKLCRKIATKKLAAVSLLYSIIHYNPYLLDSCCKKNEAYSMVIWQIGMTKRLDSSNLIFKRDSSQVPCNSMPF